MSHEASPARSPFAVDEESQKQGAVETGPRIGLGWRESWFRYFRSMSLRDAWLLLLLASLHFGVLTVLPGWLRDARGDCGVISVPLGLTWLIVNVELALIQYLVRDFGDWLGTDRWWQRLIAYSLANGVVLCLLTAPVWLEWPSRDLQEQLHNAGQHIKLGHKIATEWVVRYYTHFAGVWTLRIVMAVPILLWIWAFFSVRVKRWRPESE